MRAARHFAHAAQAAGVSRIVYLGGLGDAGEGLSAHLRSRRETGDVLRSAGVPVIEFQASIILGSGSLSYELLRALVERLPVMLCPSWVRTPTQPIAIEDVVAYLRAALDLPAGPSQVFQIGGADVTSYAGILREYARQRGLRRVLIPVPVLTPYLSSLWLGLTTPIYARVGRKLVESLRNATVVRDDAALRTFPIRPMGLTAGARARADLRGHGDRGDALERRPLRHRRAARRTAACASAPAWSTPAPSRSPCRPRRPSHPSGGSAAAPAGTTAISCGGCAASSTSSWAAPGCAAAGAIPSTSGSATRSISGASSATSPTGACAWPPRCASPDAPGSSSRSRPRAAAPTIRQTAIFEPVGLWGLVYWYAIYPLHARVFRGMLRGIAAAAVTFQEQACRGSVPGKGRAPTDPFSVSEPERA